MSQHVLTINVKSRVGCPEKNSEKLHVLTLCCLPLGLLQCCVFAVIAETLVQRSVWTNIVTVCRGIPQEVKVTSWSLETERVRL